MFRRIRNYYASVGREIEEQGPVDLSDLPEPIILIPLKRLDRVGRKALRLALSLTPAVQVVQIRSEDIETDDLSSKWKAWVEEPAAALGRPCPELVVLPSAYREFFTPFLDHLHRLSKSSPERPIAVIVPELVEKRWYHFLFRHRATLLKGLLILRGGPQVIIITAPWYVRDALNSGQLATGSARKHTWAHQESPAES